MRTHSLVHARGLAVVEPAWCINMSLSYSHLMEKHNRLLPHRLTEQTLPANTHRLAIHSTTKSTHEGYHCKTGSPLVQGIPCRGVVWPDQKLVCKSEHHDAIIIGAGYAGLTAARDLTTQGTIAGPVL
jgi:hypothetical protein